jgi:hypothetical protein
MGGVQKTLATRTARGTKGKKQEAAIKGTPAATAPAVTAAPAPAGATPAVTSQPTGNAPTGNVPPAHA